MFDFYGQTLLSTTKLSILAGFTWLLILYKIQDGGQDGNHVWWERLSIEGIVSKYCDISKTQKMGSINPPPPPPLVPQWRYVYVYVRGLSFGYRENLFLFFELFKFDKSRYFPEN